MTDEELFKEYNASPIKWMQKNDCKTTKDIALKLMELAREQERKSKQPESGTNQGHEPKI